MYQYGRDMTWRNIGQKAVVCDNCGAIFDDRPRDPTKDVVKAAMRAGWKVAEDKHYCPKCDK